jgi:hypothetical protein
VHGKLQVTVADTASASATAAPRAPASAWPTSASGCKLLYGDKATLTVSANQPSGTVVTITVPYRTVSAPGDAPRNQGNGFGATRPGDKEERRDEHDEKTFGLALAGWLLLLGVLAVAMRRRCRSAWPSTTCRPMCW